MNQLLTTFKTVADPLIWPEFAKTIPELVVEIRSKNDTTAYIERKVQDYLTAGVAVVLLVDPASRTANAYRPNREPVSLSEHDKIGLDDVIQGFKLSLGQLLS